jgi:hypothetical protein
MIIFVQKREAIEANHFVCDPAGPEEITNGLGNENDDL